MGAYRDAPRRVRRYLRVMEKFTLRGGKRFRALCVLAGYHVATGRAPDPALPAASALEHFQSWMLIHDDIIDHGEKRRGGPTMHRELARWARHPRSPGAADYGTGLAITLGDLEEPFTVGALLSCPVPLGARLAALDEYRRMTQWTAYGQILDIENGAWDPRAVTERDVLIVHRLKSAVYTVASPLAIGALLGGWRPPQLADLRRIALDLGVAFQLRDDVLGAGLSGGRLDKDANDLTEGKRTLLVVRALSTGTPRERAAVRAVLGNPRASRTMIRRAQTALQTSGSLAYSERTISRLTRRALGRLARSATLPARSKPLIEEIADRLVHRTH